MLHPAILKLPVWKGSGRHLELCLGPVAGQGDGDNAKGIS